MTDREAGECAIRFLNELPRLREVLASDVQAAYEGDPAATNLDEIIFSYPGLGNLLYIAVSNHDYPLMQALFLVISVSMLVAIFVVDLLYVRLDPRVRRA